MKNNEPVIIEHIYNSPLDKVWDAITDYRTMKYWYFKELESFEPVVGFETQFNIREKNIDYLHVWKVTEVLPFKRIVYEWTFKGMPGDSFVTWELFPEDNNTRLKLTHIGIDSFAQDNPDLSRESFTEGWDSILGKSLKNFLEKQ
ncbi:MAG: SRPBCC domain-containing protein [Ignavibacteria bacterium]|nr:SRPBCC domain-containing protein [Ignavibacteria bacterium]